IVVSIVSGLLVTRTGRYRVLAVVGQAVLALGMFLLSTIGVDTPRWQLIAYMMLMGVGLGVAMPLYTLIVQNAFPPRELGVVTSATTFFRSIGGTIGIALLGTIVNNRFAGEYAANLPPAVKASPQIGAFLTNLSPQALISPETILAIQGGLQRAGLPAAQVTQLVAAIQAPIRPALAVATTESFLIGAIILAFAVASAALIPELSLRKTNQGEAPATEGDWASDEDFVLAER
ncbi:MAG TPA: MFS transporter, partial [Chloroflexota bacterium]|nr:MFS transporter [Chloroflexota bacterium]